MRWEDRKEKRVEGRGGCGCYTIISTVLVHKMKVAKDKIEVKVSAKLLVSTKTASIQNLSTILSITPVSYLLSVMNQRVTHITSNT